MFVTDDGVLYVATDVGYDTVRELLPEGMLIPDMIAIAMLRSPSMKVVAEPLGGSPLQL
jgi:hypothetical protein